MGYTHCGDPGAQFVDFVLENKRLGTESIATIPLVDYVSADKKQEVSESEKAPGKRWVRSYAHKSGPYATTPDRSDDAVYQDEFVNFLVQKLGKASAGGIKFYSLDNEPALWSSTHPRIHPEKTTYQEIVARTEATALQITALDPTAMVLGGVSFGWSEYMSLQSAPDSKEYNAKYDTYLDFFLASMKALEQKHHRRLVHVLDVHWYPEARGLKRITDDDVSRQTVDARVQAPRELWDPTYREKSWIDDAWGKPIRLIPWLREKIAKGYPGTLLSMTEYDFGQGEHISGGLAQVDVLGAFGREGVYLANYWGKGPGNNPIAPYIAAAFKLYRNYDGKGGTYGDTAVTAKADVTKASVYAAVDSKRPNLLTIIAINKDQRARYTGKITLQGKAKYGSAHAYVLDKSAPEVRGAQPIEIKNNEIEYVLAPLSATLFVCEKR
jgi:mannan endo-1,4-beta-mannosidase